MAIHADLTKLSQAELIARVIAAETAAVRKLSFKVGEKGGVSVYGLGRFPTTLYAGQWERLAEAMPAVLAFIKANAATVTRK